MFTLAGWEPFQLVRRIALMVQLREAVE